MATLQVMPPPTICVPDDRPSIPLEEYDQRLCSAVDAMKGLGLDVLVVYGDREHFATLAFLCGFDPRFEEALLLLDTRGKRRLLVGNECLAYVPDEALGIETVLYQDFSLVGQPRDRSSSLRRLLTDFGLALGARVGCAGWKYLSEGLVDDAETAIEIPAFIVDLLRDLVGAREGVVNANAIFIDSQNGLRTTSSASQIAQFEYAAALSSCSVGRALKSLAVGVRERDLETRLENRGIPLSCHTVISFGDKVRRGPVSPSDRRAVIGDAFVVAFGLQGSLTCRGGAVATGPQDLGRELRHFFPGFICNYFDVVATWYECVGVGSIAGEVFDRVDRVRDASLFAFALNPGHYSHLDEWVQSPFRAGDTTVLRSGMVLQTDIIPVSAGPFCYVNIEDTVAIADESLRSALQRDYPNVWSRIDQRRDYLHQRLGIDLPESVLPLSNTPAWHSPYALSPELALTR